MNMVANLISKHGAKSDGSFIAIVAFLNSKSHHVVNQLDKAILGLGGLKAMVKINRLTESKAEYPKNPANVADQSDVIEAAEAKESDAHADAENSSPNASLRTDSKKIKKSGPGIVKKAKDKAAPKRKYTRRQVVQHRFITEKISSDSPAAQGSTPPADRPDAAMLVDAAFKRRLLVSEGAAQGVVGAADSCWQRQLPTAGLPDEASRGTPRDAPRAKARRRFHAQHWARLRVRAKAPRQRSWTA